MATTANTKSNRRQWASLFTAALVMLAGPRLGSAAQPEPAVRVSAVRYSPDGKHLAIGYGEREAAGGLLVLDAADHKVLHKISEDKGISSIAYSPDGRWLAYSVFNQSPRILGTNDYRLHVRLPDDHRGPVSFSPDSRLLATPHTDHSARLYDIEKQADAIELKGATDRVLLVRFSNDGKRLLSGGYNGGTLWDIETRQPVHRFKHGQSILVGGVFSPDDSLLLTTGWDATARIWSTADGKQRGVIQTSADRVDVSAPAGLLAVGGHGLDVKIFGDPFAQLANEQAEKLDQAIAAWESDNYEIREQASQAAFEVGFVGLTRLQELVATSESPEVRVRARAVLQELGQRERFSLEGHWNSITALAFAPRGKEIASGSEDGTVRLWDTKDGRELHLLRVLQLAAAGE